MRSEKEILRAFRTLRTLSKYGITGIAFLLVLHCGMLYKGFDPLIVHVALVLFALSLGIILSSFFKLCLVHKCMVVYICAVLLCIVLRRRGMFGDLLDEARLAMHIIGVVLFIGVLWKARTNCWK